MIILSDSQTYFNSRSCGCKELSRQRYRAEENESQRAITYKLNIGKCNKAKHTL